MDDTQHLLRRLNRHRLPPGRPSARPPVRLSCWKCALERVVPRPDSPLACACGGVFIEPLANYDDDGLD